MCLLFCNFQHLVLQHLVPVNLFFLELREKIQESGFFLLGSCFNPDSLTWLLPISPLCMLHMLFLFYTLECLLLHKRHIFLQSFFNDQFFLIHLIFFIAFSSVVFLAVKAIFFLCIKFFPL